jgi:hypothetical protein
VTRVYYQILRSVVKMKARFFRQKTTIFSSWP